MGAPPRFTNFLTWDEPVCVKRVERGRRIIPHWFHLVPLGFIVLFLVIGLVVRTNEPWWIWLLVGSGFGGLSYLLPMVDGMSAAVVVINARGITRMDHMIVRHIPALAIVRSGVFQIPRSRVSWAAHIDRATLGGQDMRVLDIYGEGDELIARLGLFIDDEPTVEKLEESFAYNGGRTFARVGPTEQGAVA